MEGQPNVQFLGSLRYADPWLERGKWNGNSKRHCLFRASNAFQFLFAFDCGVCNRKYGCSSCSRHCIGLLVPFHFFVQVDLTRWAQYVNSDMIDMCPVPAKPHACLDPGLLCLLRAELSEDVRWCDLQSRLAFPSQGCGHSEVLWYKLRSYLLSPQWLVVPWAAWFATRFWRIEIEGRLILQLSGRQTMPHRLHRRRLSKDSFVELCFIDFFFWFCFQSFLKEIDNNCAGPRKNLSMTMKDANETYWPGYYRGRPTPEEARDTALWTCAMGTAACDMAYCAYSFCELNGSFGIYNDCNGWDPIKGISY